MLVFYKYLFSIIFCTIIFIILKVTRKNKISLKNKTGFSLHFLGAGKVYQVEAVDLQNIY